jgi:hypothetical protein
MKTTIIPLSKGNIKLIEDCILESQQHEYHNVVKSINWSYNKTTLYPLETPINTDTVYDVGQLTCAVPNHSVVYPLLAHFGPHDIARVKINLLWRCPESTGRHNGLHRDESEDYLSGVYYVNDSDGDTVIFDNTIEHRFTPKKGSMIIFPSNLLHASSNPVLSYERIVINMIVKVK